MMFQLKWTMIVIKCREFSISVQRLITKTIPMLFMSHRMQHWSIKWNRSAHVWVSLEHHMQSQGMWCYTGNMHQLSVNSFAKGNVNNEASENASISSTISHRCDNLLRTLCALCRAMVVMSVYQHGHRWLLLWDVTVVASKSGWLLRFQLSHLCLHCNVDNTLVASKVDSALITADLTVARSDIVFSVW